MKRDESGFFQLDKDLEAVAEFMRDVERRSLVFANTKAKVDYMIEQDFYENFYEQYSTAEIEEVYQITHAYNFSFPSYMAASKFYTDYAVKTNDRKQYLEHYPDRVAAVALHLGRGNADTAGYLPVR